MGLQAVMKRAVMAMPAAALAFGIASNADAQTTSQTLPLGCRPAAAVKADLKSNKQEPIIFANRITDGHPVAFYTSNSDGSLGYAVSGDATYGTPSTKLCIGTAYKDIKLNDPKNPVIPSHIPVDTTASANNLNKIYSNQGRVIFTAQSFKTNPNGTEQLGRMLAIIALPDRTGGELAIDSSGKAFSAAAFRDLTINERVNLAQSGPTTTLAAAGSTLPALGLNK